jgi:hypothetical protein
MNCGRAQQDLQLYIDGRLDQRRFSLVEAHLDSCADCQHTLALYEIVEAALADQRAEREPANLTALIMTRIALSERRKNSPAVQPFAWRWSDALLATVFGTASTLLFLLIHPALRTPFFMTIDHSFPMLATLVQAEGPGSIPWIAWIIWITAGVGITIWLAGAEVRATWRRSLTQRLQLARPEFRQLW